MTSFERRSLWWRDAVVYQVYPRSWQDTDGNGVGDIPGIISRLDHLVELGVDALWVSPVYTSPMADFGYDVADYTDIDPIFGTLADADRLIAECHRRGIYLLMDFVPNHSSDQHPWFQASRSSRDDPKRDWYVWRDPGPDGGVPNNWQSSSGGPAWEWDEATGQYYLHKFLPQQPDLNWRNPAVRDAMLDAMRFWFERGVDGFRLDVVYQCIEDAEFRDDPVNPDYDPETDPPFEAVRPLHSTDRDEVMELVVNPMRRLADEMGDRLLVGEIYLPFERLVRYYGEDDTGVQLPFNFALIGAEWSAPALAGLIAEYESHLEPRHWPNWVLGNHDKSRIATRVGPEQARVAAMLLLTLRGTPTIYYGDEIGMSDAHIPPDRVRDRWEENMPGLGEGRDPCRTPMHWTAAEHGDFCPDDVEPWLPMGDNGNVAAQEADPASMLNLHKNLLKLRREHAAVMRGSLTVHHEGDVLLLERDHEGERVRVALNVSSRPQSLPEGWSGKVLLSTHPEGDGTRLRASEGVVLSV